MKPEMVMIRQLGLDDDIAENLISFGDVSCNAGHALIHTVSHLLNSHHFVHCLSQLICLIRVILLTIKAITKHSSPV